MSKFREAKLIVEDVLKTSFRARNDDKELLIQALALGGFKWTEENLAIFRGFYSTETLRRVRQKLQEEGFYTAGVDTQRKRKRRAKEVARDMKDKWWERPYTLRDQQGNIVNP